MPRPKATSEVGADGGLALTVRALERLWTAVRNYGVEHAATRRAAADAIEIMARSGEGNQLTLRILPGHFASASDAKVALPAELASRLYGIDIAALTIATDQLGPHELIQFMGKVGARSLDEAGLQTEALVGAGLIPSIKLLRMRFDSLRAGADVGDGALWDQLVAQLLNPRSSEGDHERLAAMLEQAVQSGVADCAAARRAVIQAAHHARDTSSEDGSVPSDRLRQVIAALRPETRARLTGAADGGVAEQLDQVVELVDLMPVQEGLRCLNTIDLASGRYAPAGLRMVQRLARVASNEPDVLRDIGAVVARWAGDAKDASSTHAEALQAAARLLRVDDDQAYNPEEYDAQLRAIAASMEDDERETSSDVDSRTSEAEHLALGLELLAAPADWGADRLPVLAEVDRLFADDRTWVDDELCVLIERLGQIRLTAQDRSAREKANAVLDRLLASPQGLRLFARAGLTPAVGKLLRELASANVPAGISLLAQLRRHTNDEQTYQLVEACTSAIATSAIRDRIRQAIASEGGSVVVLLDLADRLPRSDLREVLEACLAHRSGAVRAAALATADRLGFDVPTP